MKALLLGFTMLALTATPIAQAAAPNCAAAAPATVQINKARIDRALAEMVSGGRAVGVSALLWKDGREVYFGELTRFVGKLSVSIADGQGNKSRFAGY